MTVKDLVSAVAALPAPERRCFFDRLGALRDGEPPAPPLTAHESAGAAPDRTAHGCARHLAGSVPGPADLSSNPAHLHGFGDRPARP